MTLSIGTKVKLKQKRAKWHLDNPDVHMYPNGTYDSGFEPAMHLFLTCCLGEPVIGTIVGYGDDCYRIVWKVGPFTYWHYFMRTAFTISK